MPNSAHRSSISSLWRHADFLRLWAGQSISLLGSQITLLALPLTAVRLLHASPFQMATLAAVGFVPSLLFSLPIGVLVDRVRRRPLMIAANLGRAAVLAAIPLAYLVGIVTLPLLYVVAFISASLGIAFGVAYVGFLPSLLSPDQLPEGNSKLEVSRNVASTAGPGIAGILIQVLSGPGAILLDAISYVVSAVSLALTRTPEPQPREHTKASLYQDLREGFSFVLGRPAIRFMILAVGAANLFLGGWAAEDILYMTRYLHLGAVAIGWILAPMGPGGILGRTNAISNLVMTGTVPIGSLLGGALAQLIGVRPMLIGVGCGVIVAFGVLVVTPVYRYRRQG